MARLRVFTGPMFAGKSTALLEAAEEYDAVLVFKPELDDRYAEEEIVTHDGRSLEAEVVASDADGVEELEEQALDEVPDAVAIDEGQFFDEALVDAVGRLLAAGIDVVVTGLEKDYRQEGFGPMPELVSRADTVKRMTADCDVCGGPATRTQRLVDGEPAREDAPQVDVDGKDSYEARCADCHEVRPAKE
ncbi:MAG: thymidine kinase [Candidatus Nanohaloarchaea archaeon]|nr:thymidine kinase [Candidatus Nanohaloarchaea archaeon]